MGRRDAVQTVLEVVARMRVYLPNLLVTYEPGWETRGNGTSPNYDFTNVHHTASASSLARPFPTHGILRDGRAGLSGPLCNAAGPACTVEAPRLHIIAAPPANHAGASRASGPVPALSLYNPRTLGLEIDYAGSTEMLPGQRLVAVVWSRAVADVLAGGNVEVARAHAETSITGKWDPGYAPGKTINMTAFRADARALTPGGAAEMPLTTDEIERIAARSRDYIATAANPWGLDSLRAYMVAIQAQNVQLAAAIAAADANDSPAELVKGLTAPLVAALVPALSAQIAADVAVQVPAGQAGDGQPAPTLSVEQLAAVVESTVRRVFGALDE